MKKLLSISLILSCVMLSSCLKDSTTQQHHSENDLITSVDSSYSNPTAVKIELNQASEHLSDVVYKVQLSSSHLQNATYKANLSTQNLDKKLERLNQTLSSIDQIQSSMERFEVSLSNKRKALELQANARNWQEHNKDTLPEKLVIRQ